MRVFPALIKKKKHQYSQSVPLPNQELERSWREYDKLEGDVTLAKNNLLEQLEALGSPQVG